MKMNIKNIFQSLMAGGMLLCAASCTDLTENVYDSIVKENYYNNRNDVIRAYIRPFEHGFWSITSTFDLQEGTADQMGTYNRETWWYDEGTYQRLHYHTWTIDDDNVYSAWYGGIQGAMLCNAVLDDFDELNPEKFYMQESEFEEMRNGLRTMRAWFYITLLDMFRNVPLVVSQSNQSLNSVGQVEPQVLFDFIEKELKEVLPYLPVKDSYGGNNLLQGQWTQGGAAALLVKLYLNAEKWIGKAHYTECAEYAQRIINNEYGVYKLSSTWDEPFDWNNETCDELLFGYTSSKTRANWHMHKYMYWWCLPFNIGDYIGFKEWGTANPKYALQPSRDVAGNLYNFTLGMPVARFQKYPADYRLTKYRNLSGSNQREGMFLYGYLEYENNGQTTRIKSPNGYEYYIRDQVGMFRDTLPGTPMQNQESNMNRADHNSGWHPVKYPYYREEDSGSIESDYAFIRLAEIHYSLAECKFRAGDVEGAARLLNEVRRRNYPLEYHAEYLYAPEGAVTLTADELLDEWGREFLAEGRRRIDLCRWNKFSTGTWWDKQPDADNHTDIFPFHRKVLNSDPNMKQNPGYDDINRN